jgi:hypothetical protein
VGQLLVISTGLGAKVRDGRNIRERGAAGAAVWIRYGADEVREVSFERLGQRHFDGSVPWRAMRSRRGQTHLTGSYWSSTMGTQVIFESQLELARLLLADFDPEVVGIRAQPCWMRHRGKGRVRRHVPDFLLTLRSSKSLLSSQPAGTSFVLAE